MTSPGDSGVEKSSFASFFAGWPKQQNLISFAALSFVNRESQSRLNSADPGWMQQSINTAA